MGCPLGAPVVANFGRIRSNTSLGFKRRETIAQGGTPSRSIDDRTADQYRPAEP
jgi:hypothetical protein